jgi:hypothetical protein
LDSPSTASAVRAILGIKLADQLVQVGGVLTGGGGGVAAQLRLSAQDEPELLHLIGCTRGKVERPPVDRVCRPPRCRSAALPKLAVIRIELPGVLAVLAERWQFELGSPIPRGSVSAAFWCRMADGRRAVLKVSPDRARLVFVAAAPRR